MNRLQYIDRSCLGKSRYWDHTTAMIYAIKRQAKGAPPLRAYKCGNCGGYHLTKQIEERRAA